MGKASLAMLVDNFKASNIMELEEYLPLINKSKFGNQFPYNLAISELFMPPVGFGGLMEYHVKSASACMKTSPFSPDGGSDTKR